MLNFSFHNPVKIIFGKGTIAKVKNEIPAGNKVMVVYGGGSIKKNGIYDEVMGALKGFDVIEFSGIEPNPHYETCMKAIELVRKEKVGFLLAVGGGSVLDGTKFIAAGSLYKGDDPWEFMMNRVEITDALPIGAVMTLPATGSEMNGNAVVSKVSTNEKWFFASPLVYPKFSVLDPEATYSLPERQTVNGIIDTWIHTCEQYMTYPVDSPIQDGQAETVFRTLLSEAPKVLADPKNYNARANIMWAATMGLNHLLGSGVPADWATHGIGHEFTALFGIDHGRTLAAIAPSVYRHQFERKKEKLAQYGRRVFHLEGENDEVAEKAIVETEKFFEGLGAHSSLKPYDLPEGTSEKVAARIEKQGRNLGEHMDIGPKQIKEIVDMALF